MMPFPSISDVSKGDSVLFLASIFEYYCCHGVYVLSMLDC